MCVCVRVLSDRERREQVLGSKRFSSFAEADVAFSLFCSLSGRRDLVALIALVMSELRVPVIGNIMDQTVGGTVV